MTPMHRLPAIAALLCLLVSPVVAVVSAAEEAAAERVVGKTAWGEIVVAGREQGAYDAMVRQAPSDGRLSLPTPFPHLIRATVAEPHVAGTPAAAVDFLFNQDATELHVLLPAGAALPANSQSATRLRLETAERSRQFPDGRLVFSALDAQVQGSKAKLESHPGSHRIGFWTDPHDRVVWNFKATRWGMYRVLLTYSCAGPDGNEIAVQLAGNEADGTQVTGTLRSTGSWYRYTTIDLGKLYLKTAGPYALTVSRAELKGGAVMNLKGIMLLPACEGTPPVQGADGLVTLHARDATVHGTTLRWEPAEKKQTLGFWVKPSDAASWTFTLDRPGDYTVEVMQGCGGGQGGSQMRISAGDQTLDWQVEETGHFQNFKTRTLGKLHFAAAGVQQLRVGPTKIAKQAACDIRQIRLVPVKE